MFGKEHMGTNVVNDMKYVKTIWNGADKRNIQNKRRKQNKFIFITKYEMIHLKHYYGSIIVRKIVLRVCVCVCVCD